MIEQLSPLVGLHSGDCIAFMASQPENSFDAICCDPPYHLTSIVKRFGGDNAAPAIAGKTGVYARSSAGFMGKAWDGGDIAFQIATWQAALRVLKPGGHLVAFSGSRTYHRMACAIEDAGFEVRDQIMWLYGSGFPKSLNLGGGRGTALKPGHEPMCLARKPLSATTVAGNVATWSTGGLNVDACRVSLDEGEIVVSAFLNGKKGSAVGWTRPWMDDVAEVVRRHEAAVARTNSMGRWPANVCHDGSDEVLAGFPVTGASPGGVRFNSAKPPSVAKGREYERQSLAPLDEGGSNARFFYEAKAGPDDRCGSLHPTIKPVSLMRWLVRLVTPPGGRILDPFAGSGTTGQAAALEGLSAVLCEMEPQYQADIRRRIAMMKMGNDEKRVVAIKARGRADAHAGPLLGGPEASGGGGRTVYGNFARDDQSGQQG